MIDNKNAKAKIRLIGADGKMVGIVELEEAQQLALDQNMDLIEVTDKAEVPVYKLGDRDKMRYHEEKLRRKEAKKQRADVMKVVKIRFNEGQHDLKTKAKRAKEFLEEGRKVKVVMFLAGREKSHFDLALEKTKMFFDLIETDHKFLQEIKKLSNGFEAVLIQNFTK